MVDVDRDRFDVTAPGGAPRIECRACGASKSEPWRNGVLDAWAFLHRCEPSLALSVGVPLVTDADADGASADDVAL